MSTAFGRARTIPVSGTGSEEQLSGTSLEIFADFRHAVIYAGY
jgi:hypothetical protein